METLSNELKDLGEDSTNASCKEVYKCVSGEQESTGGTGSNGRRSTIRGVSVASQFRSCLQSLVSDLERTQPHYIRCIKPNVLKSAYLFSSGEVLKQLRYSGMMEAIRIRREGYALREEHESFYNRFSILLLPEDDASGIEQLVKVLSKRLNVTDADWQIGHSKIFLRRELAQNLERLSKLRVYAGARTIGRFGRFVAHRRGSRLLVAWIRFRLHMSRMHRRDRAASRIGASFRAYGERQKYQRLRRALVVLQSNQRRKDAIQRVRKLRDPYVDMTFEDLTKLLDSEKSRLEEAVKGKNYVLAAELEAKMCVVERCWCYFVCLVIVFCLFVYCLIFCLISNCRYSNA
jgi:myosin heavy subunit